MRTFHCSCDNTIFFENSRCVACHSELGWCPACDGLRAIAADEHGHYHCQHSGCGARLIKCHNYAVHHVCNRCIAVPEAEPPRVHPLCDYCDFNEIIPDLSVPGNRERWHRIEMAKRRLFYTLDLIGAPYRDEREPELSFDFKADIIEKRRWWWAVSKTERVYTGHANGKITINIREADAVEREKARVSFQEAHRTVIGHFRHEIAHYFWELLVRGRCEDECVALFGDHENPNYSDALQHYYEHGARPNWQGRYISAYATMHPWEDFAETFATYLDMVSVLDTALNMGVMESVDPATADLKEMVDEYIRLGVLLNEMNRAMGLLDLVPEVFGPVVVKKMQFVHDLLRAARRAAESAAEK